MADFTNIPTGLKIQSQIYLNTEKFVSTKSMHSGLNKIISFRTN